MDKQVSKMILLGSGWNTIPVLFDLAWETYQIKDFVIVKNIQLEGKPILSFKSDFYNYQIIEAVESFKRDIHPLFFGLSSPHNKYKVFNDFLERHQIQKSDYINFIHPQAYIATSSELASGILLEPGCIISSQSQIDFGVTIKRGVKVGHHNHIGAFTDINPGVTLSGMINIGLGCIIGSGSVVKNGITIGDNTFIGLGSVVTKDIPPNVIAYGNPCKVVKDNDIWNI